MLQDLNVVWQVCLCDWLQNWWINRLTMFEIFYHSLGTWSATARSLEECRLISCYEKFFYFQKGISQVSFSVCSAAMWILTFELIFFLIFIYLGTISRSPANVENLQVSNNAVTLMHQQRCARDVYRQSWIRATALGELKTSLQTFASKRFTTQTVYESKLSRNSTLTCCAIEKFTCSFKVISFE